VVSVISAFRNPFADPSLPALANGAQLGHLRQQAQHPIDSMVLDGLRHQLMAPELVDECTATYHEEVIASVPAWREIAIASSKS
jgi:hypothetical protein